jgi:hypothetical protein
MGNINHAMVVRQHTGHQAGPRWGTNWIDCIAALESRASGRQLVQVRRPADGLRLNGVRALLIRHQKE